jgi:hypothetical protein
MRPSRALCLTLIAVLAGCWIVAGTEDFEPETGTSAANGGSGAGAGSSAADGTAGAGASGGSPSQGGGGQGGDGGCGDDNACPLHAPNCVNHICVCSETITKAPCGVNEVCGPGGCVCASSVGQEPVPSPDGPFCNGAYPVCGAQGCECTQGSCQAGFTCVSGTCRCDNDSDCGGSVSISCDMASGLCNCLNGVCGFGQFCGASGASCECVSCP